MGLETPLTMADSDVGLGTPPSAVESDEGRSVAEIARLQAIEERESHARAHLMKFAFPQSERNRVAYDESPDADAVHVVRELSVLLKLCRRDIQASLEKIPDEKVPRHGKVALHRILQGGRNMQDYLQLREMANTKTVHPELQKLGLSPEEILNMMQEGFRRRAAEAIDRQLGLLRLLDDEDAVQVLRQTCLPENLQYEVRQVAFLRAATALQLPWRAIARHPHFSSLSQMQGIQGHLAIGLDKAFPKEAEAIIAEYKRLVGMAKLSHSKGVPRLYLTELQNDLRKYLTMAGMDPDNLPQWAKAKRIEEILQIQVA